jgi:hypothetical protein
MKRVLLVALPMLGLFLAVLGVGFLLVRTRTITIRPEPAEGEAIE